MTALLLGLLVGCPDPTLATPEAHPPQGAPPGPSVATRPQEAPRPTNNGTKTTPEHPNILLVDIDSLRADRLDAKRDGAWVAPNLHALAEAGTRFDAAYSNSGWTTPALMSILRGRSPLLHGGKGGEMKLLAEDERALTDILELYGYSTHTLFALQRWMDDPRAGLGFQHTVYFPDEQAGEGVDDALVAHVTDALPRMQEPFFLLLHHFDVDKYPERLPLEAVHRFLPDAQGCTSARFDEAYAALLPTLGEKAAQAHVIAHYDGTLAFYDAVLGRILDGWRTSGLLDRSIVILTSNHGEDLFEHYDTVNHCGLYDSTLHVPLVVLDPRGTPGAALDAPVQTMDIGPTVLAYAGVPVDAGMEGRSLVPLVRGEAVEWPERPVFSATNVDNVSVRGNGWKLIATDHPQSKRDAWPCGKDVSQPEATWELYDLASDPAERDDLYAARPEKAATAQQQLAAWRDRQVAATEGAPTYVVGGAAKQAMQQQGYWQVVSGEGKPAPTAQGVGQPGMGHPGGRLGPPGQGGVPGAPPPGQAPK